MVEKPCLKEQCGKENKDDFNISLRLPHASTLTDMQHTQTDKSKERQNVKKKRKHFKSDIILNMIYTYTHSYMQYTHTYKQYIHISGKMINNCAPGTLGISLLGKLKQKNEKLESSLSYVG